MNIIEKQERLRALLRGKQGRDLVNALIEEVVLLTGRVDELKDELETARLYHELTAPLFKIDRSSRSAALPSALTINAAELFEPGRGFYPLEQDGNGMPFRWTGPQPEFSFSAYVDRRRPMVLQLIAIAVVDPVVQLPLTLTVDGTVLSFPLRQEYGLWIGMAELPPSSSPAATSIVFRVRETVVPNDSDRELGVAFHRLALRQVPVAAPGAAPSPAGGNAV